MFLIPENACQDEGLKYRGTTIMMTLKSIKTVDDCANVCHRMQTCKYWEHRRSAATCTLRQVYEGAAYVGGDDVTSGVSPCPKANDTCTCFIKFQIRKCINCRYS